MKKVEKEAAATKAAETAALSQHSASQKTRRGPLITFREGDCLASVWARDHMVKGEMRRFYSIKPERFYRDRMGQARYTGFFNPDSDALLVVWQKACDHARSLPDVPPEPLDVPQDARDRFVD